MLSSTTLAMLANRGQRSRNIYLDVLTARANGFTFTRLSVDVTAADMDPETAGVADTSDR